MEYEKCQRWSERSCMSEMPAILFCYKQLPPDAGSVGVYFFSTQNSWNTAKFQSDNISTNLTDNHYSCWIIEGRHQEPEMFVACSIHHHRKLLLKSSSCQMSRPRYLPSRVSGSLGFEIWPGGWLSWLLGISWKAAQLAASQEGLSSVQK
jgi:hypothetical protein